MVTRFLEPSLVVWRGAGRLGRISIFFLDCFWKVGEGSRENKRGFYYLERQKHARLQLH